MTRFGPSGNDISFYEQGFKSSIQAPAWLHDLGLTAFEVNFGRGVKMSPKTANELGEQARKHNISVSAHAPYFVNLATNDKERTQSSYKYIKDAITVLGQINASDGPNRLVVHIGSQCKLDRPTALRNTNKNLTWVVNKLREDGLDNFMLCIETMGRYKTIGNVEEICDLCAVDPCVIPTLDFGHINAWEQGSLQTNPNRIGEIIDYCCKTLGDKMKHVHIHYSAIVYTKAGEHCHTTLDDAKWAFPFEPLAAAIKAKKLEPTIICESKEIMAQDAVKLFDIYNRI